MSTSRPIRQDRTADPTACASDSSLISHHASPPRRLRLASASPRRRVLLPLLGFRVEVTPAWVDERPLEGEAPEQTALRLAEAKARAVLRDNPSEVVVGCDTIVVLDGHQLGKPVDADEARQMLVALRGRTHDVVSGMALLTPNHGYRATTRTRVAMRRYDDREIDAYVASGRPLDKAGAYAIQDLDFGPVERIEGCYLNVVGLPLCEVSRGLRTLGWPVPEERLDPPCRLCNLGRRAVGS